MTLTDEQLKELAEFVAKFLGLHQSMRPEKGRWFCNIPNGMPVYFTPDNMFQGIHGAILAHLAKREMEKQELWYRHEYMPDTKLHWFRIAIDKYTASNSQNSNYHIALWLAIRDAVK